MSGAAGKNAKASKDPRSGFVACLGRTNVGKSTLINRLLGQKLGIVSSKPQTTRRNVNGILNTDRAQIILVDTPGLHNVERAVNLRLEQEARHGADGADLIMMLTDPFADKQPDVERKIIEIVEKNRLPAILVMNKSDLPAASRRPERMEDEYGKAGFLKRVSLSAKTGHNVETLVGIIGELLPEGPPLYPPDIVSDVPEKELFPEILREKIFQHVHKELPYAAAVMVEEVKEVQSGGLYRITATIYVERDSQKGILIGGGGKVLKRIGSDARHDMETLTGSRVYLSLWVKVRKNWTKDPKSLKEFGFHHRK